ncbi:membrane-associated guanylate kinase, WW and PDZ domain-containing protein 2 [Lutzomyia longipalpis]|uniref:membrane-associated guanylate kinase, WW and PDZ domain-containing protein 2 n=1 Tax=Lutzomyia longipalpis TaxID=7200 RepID=UPI002483A28A|nr:membrane-associated guanylate kinase, WW and PDZ domain-containing protein 2 [Lutzomyia longipalpis]XP_055693693.1 membrane-associated guanylate kinase, WW and PDZ domain-containing protein 2 [Lutzomyia longipalpis]XP_055693694.1 membrane-associated guanylate kinase, WW and PDZ domain-containing protein 2 [Lutzomyia longipalpis]XP_055693695.1 membrane-associated guanylate kinase, WW and PDZ domain-containing protein 2 [Lutzomyia longipalpis]XP_055693696.1 membrane-associated guanylate kinase
MAAESDEIVSVVGNGAGSQLNGGSGGGTSGVKGESTENASQRDPTSNGDANSDHKISGSRDQSGQEVGRNVNRNKFRGNAPNYPSDALEHRSNILGEDEDGLGPLPYKWEKAYTESGELYFIDHNTGTSHWLDPRLSKFQKKSLEDCLDDELPYGWEKIHDPQYGTYFIDHVNRRTQYENPVLEAKRRVERSRPPGCPKGPIFTRNPLELRGERIRTTLLKSSRGLGFTIVGGDDNVDEFLQIKSIVPNGPAWLDGKLQTGDVLVYVNEICVLGFTHHDMVNVFQSILPGETVPLEVCRGYPLPFDPNDPNTEVVTTIAVDGINSDPEKARILMDLNMDGNYNFLDMSDPISPSGGGATLNGSAKNPLSRLQGDDFVLHQEPEVHSISIVKGAMGFGFTIADSAYGQKVKKILDRQCCKNLQEGDILLTINTIGVKQMSHGEVVQVLKDCPKNQEAVLKVQRGQFIPSAGATGKTFNLDRKMLKKNPDGLFRSGKDGGLYRSKTPTADLYSTQPKEILPTRPKTPLVDTRARAKTPSNDLNTDDNEACGGHEKITEKEGIPVDSKSNTSYPDHDSINNDLPYIDTFPKMVMTLTDRLSEVSLNPIHDKYHQDRLHSANKTFASSQSDLNSYDHVNTDFYVNAPTVRNLSELGPAPVALMAPIPTYHQDTCYCFECQDFNRQQMEYMQQQQRNMYNWQQANGRANRKVNEYLLDRRRAGFSPLESHGYHQANAWKYGDTSSGDGGFSQAPLHEEYALSEVTLERQTLGFGFRIVGGTEEGSQVTVGHIVPGGSADRAPQIATGDEILSIDGVNVVNASHHRVVQLMGEAALRGQVTMILRRKAMEKHKIYPYDVIVSRNENEGFGFVIISSTNQYFGSTIGKLIPGSPADRCGELKVGDRIVAVNRVDIAGMSHGDVVNLIKESGLHVRLTIGSPQVIANQPMKAPPQPRNEGFFVDSRFAGIPNHPQL